MESTLGKGFGPVVRQTAKWMNIILFIIYKFIYYIHYTIRIIIRILSATTLLLRCTLKYCKLLVQNSSWWWTITCSKHSFIHSVFCLTTGPKPPPKRCLHIVWSRASSFKWEYPLLSLRSSSSFLRLLPRLLATSISTFIFPSITCFRRQFLR